MKIELDQYDIEQAILGYVAKKFKVNDLDRDVYMEMFFNKTIKKDECFLFDYIDDVSKKPKIKKNMIDGKNYPYKEWPQIENDLKLELYYNI